MSKMNVFLHFLILFGATNGCFCQENDDFVIMDLGIREIPTVYIEEPEDERAPTFVEPEQYIDEIIAGLDAAIRPQIPSLSVPDGTITLNRTIYSIELVGDVSYTNGYVQDMPPISRYYRWFTAYFVNDTAYVYTEILFPNVTLVFDMSANLEVGDSTAQATHTYIENLVNITVAKNLTTNEIFVDDIRPTGVSGPKTKYAPETDLNKALARAATLQGSKLLWQTFVTWATDIFIPEVDTLIHQVQFPLQGRNA